MFDRDPIAPAELCSLERHAEIGRSVWWFVRLENGHLVDCGTNYDDAKSVAEAINFHHKIKNVDAILPEDIERMAADMYCAQFIGAKWTNLSQDDKEFYRTCVMKKVATLK